MDLRVTTTTVGTVPVVALDGTADLSAAPALHAALQRAVATAGSGDVVVELDGVTVLDDVALGLLVGAAARVRAAGGELVVVCAASRILERLADTRVDQILTIRPSIAEVTADRSGERWTPSGFSATS